MVADLCVRDSSINSNEETMGSTPYGIASPIATTGLALPQDIEINRAGVGRVRGNGSA
jgi:hypothetical protein